MVCIEAASNGRTVIKRASFKDEKEDAETEYKFAVGIRSH